MRIYPLLFLLFTGSISFAQDTTYYSVVGKGKLKGGQKVWQSGPNDYHYAYQYNDRGRGDSTTTVVHINSNGTISNLSITGVDYYKNPYAENFSVEGDSAVWIVNGVRKTKHYDNEMYLTSPAPASFALFIQWVLKQQNRKGAILPDGFIHADAPLLETVLVNGKAEQLKLVALYFDPSPSPFYVWLTNDGQFFAMVNSWTSNIKKGFEATVDTLLILQETAAQSFYEKGVKDNSAPLPGKIIFTHASLFQSATATVKKNMTVEVIQGTVVAVHPSDGPLVKIIKPDSIIDCKNKFLMPGVWEMHGHFAKEEGIQYLAGGVTLLRDMGNDNILLTYKRQIEHNTLLGPDISYLSGFIDKEDPFQGPTGTIIRTLDEGIKAIDEYHKLGYGQIKLYSAIKPQWVAPMAAHAHKLGMRICGHIPAFMTAEQAIREGYDEITHMNFMFLNFMSDTIDTRTPARFRLVGEHGGELDLQSKKVKDFIYLLKKKNIVLDPTINLWQGMFDEFKGDTSNYIKPVVSWLPQEYLSNLEIQSPFGTDADKANYKAAFANMLKMLKLLYDNGILLVAGTDGGEANALHHELELYVQAGVPAAQVLKIATYNAATDCGLQNKYGIVAAGRAADFILIDGDPTKNISTIRRVEWVVKNNLLYLPKQLMATMGWKYYY